MKEALFSKVKAITAQLVEIMSGVDTESIVGHCTTVFLPNDSSEVHETSGLKAPMKQCLHLLGLMIGTPGGDRQITEAEWAEIRDILNDLLDCYSQMYFPDATELPTLSTDWGKHREVAMPAFMKYFFELDLLSRDQVHTKAVALFSQFDDYLKKETGLFVREALALADKVWSVMQNGLDSLTDAFSELDRMLKAADSPEDIDPLKNENAARIGNALAQGLTTMYTITLAELEQEFGKALAEAYWRLFVSRRGAGIEYQWITDRNPIERTPLIELEPGTAMSAVGNLLYMAVLTTFSEVLLAGPHRDSFLMRRDKLLEERAEALFKKHLGADALCYPAVYETPKADKEHDLLVKHRGNLLIVECKASPAGEPFRDPDKAFVRIKRKFDDVLQEAFDQGQSLRASIYGREKVQLYDEKGRQVLELRQEEFSHVHCVCLTESNFGMLATDLSLLLSKPDDFDYPWAVSFSDLEVLLSGFRHAGLEPEQLFEYLDQRKVLHGKVVTADELDVAGYFLRQGQLSDLAKSDGRSLLTNDWGQVFDDIWIEKQGGPKADLSPVEKPAFLNLGKELLARKGLNRKIGRNEKCPCGSNVKFKRCCGR